MKGSLVTLGCLGNKQQPWQKESGSTLCDVESFFHGRKAKYISGCHKISCFTFRASSRFCLLWCHNSLQLFLLSPRLFVFIYYFLHISTVLFVCQPWYSMCSCFFLWFLSVSIFITGCFSIVGGSRLFIGLLH